MKIINAIVDFVLSIDLREIVYAAVGAFLGFWLAIIMEKKSDKKKEEETIKNSLKNILEEIKDISKTINESIDAYNQTNELGQLFIDIPIYEAAVQSGNILVLVGKPYYADLLKLYSYIKYLSVAETKDHVYSEQDLIGIRSETCNMIESIKQTLENDINRIY